MGVDHYSPLLGVELLRPVLITLTRRYSGEILVSKGEGGKGQKQQKKEVAPGYSSCHMLAYKVPRNLIFPIYGWLLLYNAL